MKKYKKEEIDELVEILKNDGVISVPTDTIYGLCANMNSIKAQQKLYECKNRPINKLFSVMCADKEQIKEIAIVDEIAEKIIDAFMPGPITLILMKRPEVPEYVTNGDKSIAIRMATSKELEELIRKNGSPLFMTSANQSGEPICKTLDEIEKNCPMIDGMMEGEVSYGKGSTIIDCTSDNIKIVRQGPITLEEIQKVLNEE